MIKVMLVDDHPIVRQGLRLVLSANGEIDVVAEADTAAAAVEQAREEGHEAERLRRGRADDLPHVDTHPVEVFIAAMGQRQHHRTAVSVDFLQWNA